MLFCMTCHIMCPAGQSLGSVHAFRYNNAGTSILGHFYLEIAQSHCGFSICMLCWLHLCVRIFLNKHAFIFTFS